MTRKRFTKLMRYWFYQHRECFEGTHMMGRAYRNAEVAKILPEEAFIMGLSYQKMWDKIKDI